MKTKVCEMFGIDVPIFAFSHCRDVVVAASKAGGMGVFGADMFSPEELKVELEWIERHIDGKPYGIDVLFPGKYLDVQQHEDKTGDVLLPGTHRQFTEELLARHGVPHLPGNEEQEMIEDRLRRGRSTPAYSQALLDVAFSFSGVKLMVSAIGTPPPEVVVRARNAGIKLGGMVGAVAHALRQKEAGVDLLIAQGYEAGGHTGEIASMVLTPQVVDAVAPLPVLAAGGIATGRQMAAALALGAEGVWCGSVWLTTAQSDLLPETKRRLLQASSTDTSRTRSYTGKPARFLKNAWTEAWEGPGAPPALMRPLQHLLSKPATRRIERARAEPLLGTPVGQVVGQMNEELTVRQVYENMMGEFADSYERIVHLVEGKE
jgi:NAD(P)H-dependent flavin oxidoreductase YrpB (nitropropane dioxygenase family)